MSAREFDTPRPSKYGRATPLTPSWSPTLPDEILHALYFEPLEHELLSSSVFQ